MELATKEMGSPTGELCIDSELRTPRQAEGMDTMRGTPTSAGVVSEVSSLAMSETWLATTGNWVLPHPHLHPIFPDSEGMKEKVRQSLVKPAYNVTDFYKERGCWQRIARSPWFENITLVVIATNALWLAYDADKNTAEVSFEAAPVFQVAEHTFCTFFLFEWVVRFMAFKLKRDGLKDSWFLFDSTLVLMMVLETWALAIIMALSGGSGGLQGSTTLRLVRLLRLTRMARMARLLRALPELMILIKGMRAAFRSVFLTLCLLVAVIYVFAIAFTQLAADTTVGDRYFASVGEAMYTLLLRGTFLDNIGLLVNEIGKESMVLAAVFLFFVLLAALTIMNMLIGVLVEVVSVVAAVEKEEMAVSFVKRKLADIVFTLDKDGNRHISKAEFEKILVSPEATKALQEVDVDVVGLVDLADFIFEDDAAPVDDEGNKQLTFPNFMEVVMQLRGTNTATVKDIVTLRKFIRTQAMQTNGHLEKTNCRLARIEDKLRAALPECYSRPSLARARSGSSGCLSRASTRPTLPDANPGDQSAANSTGSKNRSPSPDARPAHHRQRRMLADEIQWSSNHNGMMLKKANSWQSLSSLPKDATAPDVSPCPEPRRPSVVARHMCRAAVPTRSPDPDAVAKARTNRMEPMDIHMRATQLESELNMGLAELQKVLAALGGQQEGGAALAAAAAAGLADRSAGEERPGVLDRGGSCSSFGSSGSGSRSGGALHAASRLPPVPGIPECPAGPKSEGSRLGDAVSTGLSQLQRQRSRSNGPRAAAVDGPGAPASVRPPQRSPPPRPAPAPGFATPQRLTPRAQAAQQPCGGTPQPQAWSGTPQPQHCFGTPQPQHCFSTPQPQHCLTTPQPCFSTPLCSPAQLQLPQQPMQEAWSPMDV